MITCTDSHRPEEEADTLRKAVVAGAVAVEERHTRRSAAVAEARGTAVPRQVEAGSGAGRCAEAAGAEETSMTTGETAEAGDSTIQRPTLPAEKVAEQGKVAGIPSPAAMVVGRNAAARDRKAEMDTLARPQLADWAVVGSMPTQSTAEAEATRTAMHCSAVYTEATSEVGVQA